MRKYTRSCVMMLAILATDGTYAATQVQTFDTSWTVSPWNYYGEVAAQAWNYTPYTVWNSTLGTLDKVEVHTVVSGSRSNPLEPLTFAYGFFTGNSDGEDWQLDSGVTFASGSSSISWQEMRSFTGSAMADWLTYDYLSLGGTQGAYYVETRALTSTYTIVAQTRLTYTYTPTTPPSPMLRISVDNATQTQSQAGYPTISGTLPFVKSGLGVFVLNAANTLTGPTTVAEGTLQISHAFGLASSAVSVQPGATLIVNTAGSMQAPSLTLTGSSQAILPTAIRQIVSLGSLAIDDAGGGRLDIGKGRIEIAMGGITEADLRADLMAGRGTGNFHHTNVGIVTSAPNPSSLMVPVIGYNILPSGAAIVAWSAFGDLNLDGGVDFDDVVQFVAANRYDTGLPATWAQGDFDYNGVVDFDDIVAFTGSRLYDKGSYLPAPLAPSGMAAFSGESLGVAAVPEPATWVMGVVGIAGAGWGARRRKRA